MRPSQDHLDLTGIGTILTGLNSHLQDALVNLEECAVRLQILARFVRAAEEEAGHSLWPYEDLSSAQGDEITVAIANITRHFLGRPF